MEYKFKPLILSINSGILKKIGITLLGFLFITSFSYTQNRSIIFESGKWQEIKDKAKKENKLIFVDCYTSWCGPCRWMAQNIFTNDSVADLYNKNFICVQFDMEKDEGLLIEKEYAIYALPTFIFVDGDGKLIYREHGLQPVNFFIELGKDALNPKLHYINGKEPYNGKKQSVSYILLYLKFLEANGVSIKRVKDEYFKTQKESDLTSQINWTILFQFSNNLNSREFKYLLYHKDKFAKIYTLDSVNMLIDNNINLALKQVLCKDTTGKAFHDYIRCINKYGFHYSKAIEMKGEMYIFEAKEKWNDFANMAVIYIEKYKMDDSRELNEIAWKFYEKIEDKTLLEKAVAWSKQSVNLNPIAAYYDTYACLTFKLGKKEEAIKLEEQAMKLAKESGESTTEYEKNIEKFKK